MHGVLTMQLVSIIQATLFNISFILNLGICLL